MQEFCLSLLNVQRSDGKVEVKKNRSYRVITVTDKEELQLIAGMKTVILVISNFWQSCWDLQQNVLKFLTGKRLLDQRKWNLKNISFSIIFTVFISFQKTKLNASGYKSSNTEKIFYILFVYSRFQWNLKISYYR